MRARLVALWLGSLVACGGAQAPQVVTLTAASATPTDPTAPAANAPSIQIAPLTLIVEYHETASQWSTFPDPPSRQPAPSSGGIELQLHDDGSITRGVHTIARFVGNQIVDNDGRPLIVVAADGTVHVTDDSER